jgi:hypothetical protein
LRPTGACWSGRCWAPGYQVYAVNPQVVGRCRGRHQVSRAKSDRGDAKVLAGAHQNLIWARQRHLNALRSALREFHPGALSALGAQLAEPEALAVLELAPTPEQGRQLTRAAVRRAGDDPNRYQTAKGRKAFAGTAPVTRSSGLRTTVVARAACNQRLVDACYLWAFAALTTSPGARRCSDAYRARGQTHHQALRALGNRLVGILHGCLARRVAYQEQLAWPTIEPAA